MDARPEVAVRVLWRVILLLLLLGLLGAAEVTYEDAPISCFRQPANGLCRIPPQTP